MEATIPRNGSGTYSLPAAYDVAVGQTIQPEDHETAFEDLETDMNTARPIVAGGTGATTAAAARTNLGLEKFSTTVGAETAATLAGATTETVLLKIGTGRSGDGTSQINLVGDATYTSWGARLGRAGTANGNTLLTHRGTGSLNITAQDAGTISLATSNTARLVLQSGGAVTLSAASDLVANGQSSFDAGALLGTAASDQAAIRQGVTFVSQETVGTNLYLSKANVGTSSFLARFGVNGTQVGSITATASSTAYNTSSDASLKANITDTTEDGVAKVKAMRVRDFVWKDSGKRETGFVAQEVRDVLPDAVAEGDDGLLMYEKAALVPMLVRTIQQLVERVEALEAR